MVRNLKKIGDELMLVIDEETAKRMSLNENTPLEFATDGERLIVFPVDTAKRRASFEQALKEVNEEWGDVLQRLAE